MQDLTLYRYEREQGKITVSPDKPEDMAFTVLHRLIADEGKILKNGDVETICVDAQNLTDWEEVDASIDATEEDYQEALKKLGVEIDE